MGIEIERKFLVKDPSWKHLADSGLACKQGYLVSDAEKTVRVRVMGDLAYLTIKGATSGFSRAEFEYEIPVPDAVAMLELCGNVVEKIRYRVGHAGMVWELDIFEGANTGLVVAEIELQSEEQIFELPDWLGEEVTGDIRYYNARLVEHPFSQWD